MRHVRSPRPAPGSASKKKAEEKLTIAMAGARGMGLLRYGRDNCIHVARFGKFF
jgi:hypothetical protein